MKTLRVAAAAVALLAGASAMASAQGGGGANRAGGNGRGRGPANTKQYIFSLLQISQDQNRVVDSIDKVFTDSTNKIRTDYNTAAGVTRGGAGGAGGRGNRGGGGTPLPDSIQAKMDTLTAHRNVAWRAVLKPDQQKTFDKAVADALAAAAARKTGGNEL